MPVFCFESTAPAGDDDTCPPSYRPLTPMASASEDDGYPTSDQVVPELEFEQRALLAIERHPRYRKATSYRYCSAEVRGELKSFVECFQFTDEVKAAIRESLKDVENCVIVSILTSRSPPQPLSGCGWNFYFVLHPLTFAVLHSHVGFWIS